MPSSHVHVLRFVSGKYKGQEFPLPAEDSAIIGRGSEADLVLADDAVSRKHARFYPSRARCWVRDLGSRNGTVINGRAVDRHCLRNGDRIAVGSSLIRVVVMDARRVSSTWHAGEKKRSRGVDEASGRAMSGNIDEVPLVDVLQWLATSRKTGTLKVRGADQGRSAKLHLRDGRVFYAEIDGARNLHPEKSLLRMLNWTRGMFELESAVLDEAPVEIQASLEHLLMEAARLQDELANLATKADVPRADARVKLVKPSPKRWKELPGEQLDLVQELVEQGDWHSILDSSAIDDVTLTKVIVELKKQGLVEYE